MIEEIGYKNEYINDSAIFLASCDYIIKHLGDPTKVFTKDNKPNQKILI